MLGIFTLLLALLVTLARFGLPWIQEQRQTLLDHLLPATLHSRVESLGLAWSNAGPTLALRGLSLEPAKESGWHLRIGEANLQLAPWQSLLQRRWVVERLQLQGLQLSLADSLWQGDEKRQQEQSRSWQPVAALLLHDIYAIALEDCTVQVTSSLGKLSTLQVDKVFWLNQDGRHKGEGSFRLAHQQLATRLHLIADFSGDGRDPASLAGQLYLATTRTTDLPELRTVQDKPDGTLDVQLWLERQQGQWQLALMQFGENRLQWRQRDRLHEVALLGGTLQWLRMTDGWQLASHGVQVEGDPAMGLHPWGLQLDYHKGLFSGRMDPIQLAAVSPFIGLLVGEESDSGKALRAMQPSGLLQDIDFSRADADPRWQFSAILQDVSWHRWQMLPGISDLSGRVRGHPDGGALELALGKQTVAVGPYFPKDIPINQLSATLQWQRMADGWQLSGNQIALQTPALEASGNFRLDLPAQGSSYLALLAGVDLHDAGQAWRYYPRLAMGEGLTRYLSRALQAGHAEGSTILWDGPLSEFPYHDGGGIFQAAVPLRDARFSFDPAWQPLEQLSLDLLFQNDTLRMDSDGAMLGKAKAPRIVGWFPALMPDGELYINADVEGEAAAVSDYLIHSGVKDSVGAALRQIDIRKPLTGDLQLAIPLDGDAVRVTGHVKLDNNQVTVTSLGLPLERVKGELFFSQNETRFDKLSAELWQQPVTLDYLGRSDGNDYKVLLSGDGKWASAQATNWPQRWRELAQGAGRWQSKLDLVIAPGGRYHYRADWSSDLQGIALSLPSPYGKPAEARQPLTLVAEGNGKESRIRADWQNGLRLESLLDHASGRFTRFWLNNQDESRYPFTPSPLSVNLAFTTLSLDQWQRWWQSLQDGEVAEQLSAAPGRLPDERALRLNVDSLQWQQQPWHKVVLALKQKGEQGSLSLGASEATGAIKWQPHSPMAINFSYLQWRTAEEKEPVTPDPMPSPAAQAELLRAIPAFDFTCQRCLWNKSKLGVVTLQARPSAKGDALDIPRFSLQTAGSQLQGHGQWRLDKSQPRSSLKVSLVTPSMERMLTDWGYDQGLVGTPAKGELALEWQGPIYRLDKPTLQGTYSLKTESGLLRKLDTAGTRLLSVLSLNGIMRRLSLDFSDVFEKGFYFKRIAFSGKVANGVVDNQDFLLEGDAGDIGGKGSVDLVQDRIDYVASFTPKFTNSLSLATAFAVTPVTGVYVLAASKLLEPVIDVVTRINFRIEGNLDNPQVTEVGRERGAIKSVPEVYKEALTP